ncbi:MAG: DUF2079 domain-containing protein [Cyanothece sp. SIO1E1]|nr:DUF2079 domain-containing protein [Cyanothece sp. SIO1E1]
MIKQESIGKSLLGMSRSVIVVAIAFWSLTLILLLHRHYSFYPAHTSFEQGVFNQLFWNGTQGQIFQSSLASTLSSAVVGEGNLPAVSYYRLGQHFNPALLLWLPLYLLIPAPVTLLVLQVTLVTAAGLVLYALARQRLNQQHSTLVTNSFYAASTVIGSTLVNFHDLCQLPLYFFGLLLALEKRWWWLFGVLATLILSIREDTGVILFSLGVYLLLSRRYLGIGLIVCAASLGYMLVVTNLLMPLFSEDVFRQFMIEQFGQYAEGEQSSTLQVIWALISHPERLMVKIITPFYRKIGYLLWQWLPLALIPAISPVAWAVSIFPLLHLFIRDDTTALAINLRYAMTVAPAFFYGAIIWWSQHPNALKPWFRRFWLFCIGFSLVFTLASNPNRAWSFIIPDSIEPLVYVSLPRQWQHASNIRLLLQQIPGDASVSATTHMLPHLSNRRALLEFPELMFLNEAGEESQVGYAVADLWQLQKYQAAFQADREQLLAMVVAIEQMREQGEYGLVSLKDGVVLMQRGEESHPDALKAWEQFRQGLEP